MGVKGLWKVLESEGIFNNCEVELSSLKGKILAVDVSIWLYQFVKSVPSGKDSALSPLVIGGLFQRVCKLLHFGIKPIFVFDGTAPALKKETISARQELRRKGEMDYSKIAKKILRNKLKLMALNELSNSKADLYPIDDNISLDLKKSKAPPIDLLSVLESSEDYQNDEDDYSVQYENSSEASDLDINSKEFKNLPYDVQEQILLQSRKRTIDSSQIAEAFTGNKSPEIVNKSDNALDFSKAQVDALIKRRKLMDELESLRGNSVKKSSESLNIISHGKIASSSDKKYIFSKNAQAGWNLSLIDANSLEKTEENDVNSLLEKKNDTKSVLSDIEDDAEFLKMMFGDAPEEFEGKTTRKPELNTIYYVDPMINEKFEKFSSTSENEEEFDFNIPSKKVIQSNEVEVKVQQELKEKHDEDDISIEAFKLITEDTIKLPDIILKDLFTSSNATKNETEVKSTALFEFVDSNSSSEDEILDIDLEYKSFVEEVSTRVTNQNTSDFKDLIDKIQSELKEFNSLSEASTLASVSPTKVLIDAFMEMLHYFKLPFIIAPFEAEAQCSAIKGISGVISDDSDCLLFGAQTVFKGFFNSGVVAKTSKLKYGTCQITISKIEEISGLTRTDLIVLAHLLGCDYCVGIEGIGPKRALELVRQVKTSEPLQTLQNIVNLSEDKESKYYKWLKCKIPLNFIDSRVSQAFLNPIVNPVSVEDLQWGKFDQYSLERFMTINAKWTKDKTSRFLKDIETKNK